MLVIATLLCVLIFVIFKSLLHDLRMAGEASKYNSTDGNLTLGNLISDTVLENWLDEPPKSTPWKASAPTELNPFFEDGGTQVEHVEIKLSDQNLTNDIVTTPDELQGDDSSVASPFSKEYFVKSLFERPHKEVEADWGVVLGTFLHFDDENWSEFLIKTEVPLLVRMLMTGVSETVTVSRAFTDDKKDLKKGKKYSSNEKDAIEMSIETVTWLVTHESKFRLGEMVVEHDFDGTDSKNVFFFSSPRLMIHNKIKDKWRTGIVRHFDETGLNMTFVDRDRLVMARRFFKRIK